MLRDDVKKLGNRRQVVELAVTSLFLLWFARSLAL